MACSETTTLVTLKGGLVASVTALQTLWGLEDRGFSLAQVGNKLQVHPAAALTAADVAAIRAHRDELLALVAYCEVM
jgi:predicted transcriptional regulator